MKAVAYYRVSSTSQVDGNGFDRQSSIVNKWCSDNDVEVVAEYYEAKTGTTEYRPVWETMLSYIKENPVDYVVIERIDRLSRDTYVGMFLRKQISDVGSTVVSATEGFLNNDPTQKLISEIIMSVAAYDKTRIVEKLALARAKVRGERGRCEGEHPYSDRDIISRVQQLRAQGHKLQSIADVLNAEGVPTKRGGAAQWHPATVARLVQR